MLQCVCESDVGLAGIRIGKEVALLLWDAALWPAPLRPPAGAAAIAHPIVSAVLPPGDRRVALVRLGPARRGEPIVIGEGGPEFAPAALGDHASALVGGLAPLARRRLLGLLLEAGLRLLRLQDSSAFRRLLATLARELAQGEPPARPTAAGPGQRRLLCANGPAPRGVVHLVGEARIVRLVVAAKEAVYALVEAPVPGEVLCEAGGGAWVRPIALAEGDVPELLDHLLTGGEAAGAMTRLLPAVLGGRTSVPEMAAVVRSAGLLAPARPRSRARLEGAVTGAVDLAIPDPEGGLFLRGWLRDPHGLVAGFALATAAGRRGVPNEAVHMFPRRDLGERFRRAAHAPGEDAQGFVAYLPDAASAAPQPDLVVALRGGASLVLTPALHTLSPT